MSGPLSTNDEAALVVRLHQGDHGAFEELFYAYVLPLTKLAYHYVQSSDLADDIVQDAFVTLWQNIGTNVFAQRPFIYLQMVVRRRSIDVLRRLNAEQSWQRSFAEDTTSPGAALSESDTLNRLEEMELTTLIASAVATLSPRVRMVATLRWYERLSRPETAEALGISVKTVDIQLAKAISSVRAYLARHGIVVRE